MLNAKKSSVILLVQKLLILNGFEIGPRFLSQKHQENFNRKVKELKLVQDCSMFLNKTLISKEYVRHIIAYKLKLKETSEPETNWSNLGSKRTYF